MMHIVKFSLMSILFLFLQLFWIQVFKIGVAVPNIILPFIIYLNLHSKLHVSSLITFFIGLALDLYYPMMLGFNATIFLILGYVVNEYHNSVSKKILSSIIFILALNFVYYFLYILLSLASGNLSFMIFWNSIFLIFYNSIFSIIIIALLSISDFLKVTIKI